MKDFDIEKLERKNVYKVDDDFFAKMQENVVQKTIYQIPAQSVSAAKKHSSIKAWTYSAAAAVAMIFGILFVVNQKDTGAAETLDKLTLTANSTSVNNMAEVETGSENTAENGAAQKYAAFASDLGEVKKEAATAPVKTEIASTAKPAPKREFEPKPQVKKIEDQIFAEFSTEDFEALSMVEESDIYMDVYY